MLEKEVAEVKGFSLKVYHIVIAIFVLWAIITTWGWAAEGFNVPDERATDVAFTQGSAGSVGVQQQQLDGANMGSGSNAERQRLSSVPRKFSAGDPVRGPDAEEYLRWCGVSGNDIAKYESSGYAAMNNPRGWLLNTAYDGEPSLKLAEGMYVDPQKASMAAMGL